MFFNGKDATMLVLKHTHSLTWFFRMYSSQFDCNSILSVSVIFRLDSTETQTRHSFLLILRFATWSGEHASRPTAEVIRIRPPNHVLRNMPSVLNRPISTWCLDVRLQSTYEARLPTAKSK